ncbi:MAG: radical SAM family heme chaperone HemW, partial [Erysipelotrichaceae bacterium]|nr:radical SAM family heme chaperone HemW [Erysipelotrichaceae bacterium]
MMNEVKHLYVHVPFCRTICYYCDFCHRVYDEKIAERWLDTLEKEIEERCGDHYETIYIGGGTPTALNVEQLERLLGLIEPYSDRVIEYTVEANPESLDDKTVSLFGRYGINRVSLGVQTSDSKLLESLNRHHSFQMVREKIQLLKDSGVDNISVDLMYSLPGQTMEMLERSIDDILSLNVPHISIYSLTIEENSVFGKRGMKPLDDETEADMYEMIEKMLTDNGYIHYEVSNYCLDGYESKHNMSYWNYDDFLGVSMSASGKIGNSRYTNTRSFERYFNDYHSRDEDLKLEKKDMMFENIMMSLR